MAIYVKFAEIKKPKTVLEFLKLFYSRQIDNTQARGHYTYSDKECTIIQDQNYWRSFDDLLELVQTYYSSIIPVKLMHYLLVLKIKLTNGRFTKPHLGLCNGMDRIRYIPYQEICTNGDYLKRIMIKSKYTWSELLKPLDIHSIEDIEKYIK